MCPRLRNSCDACNLAKVKCSKGRPKCTRCAKHDDLECVYSPSIRTGKRPKRDATRHYNSPTPTSIGNSDDWNFDDISSINFLPFDPGLDTYSVETDTTTFLGTPDSSAWTPHLPPNDSSNPTIMDSGQNEPPLDPLLSTSLMRPQPQHHHSFSSTQLLSPTSDYSNTPRSHSSSPTCECFRTVCSSLLELQNLSSSSRPAFDIALIRNKRAIAICSLALDCRCADDITFFMIIASLVTKIIDAYWKTCEECFDSAPVAARVTIGAYRLDKEDEHRVKMEIMGMELRRAKMLVSKLHERYSQAYGDYEQGVYAAFGSLLSSRLDEAFEKLPSR